MFVAEPCQAVRWTHSRRRVRAAAPRPVSAPVSSTASQKRPAAEWPNVAGIISPDESFACAAEGWLASGSGVCCAVMVAGQSLNNIGV